jgi:hypothetical protein
MGIGPAPHYLTGEKPFDEGNLVAIRVVNQGDLLKALRGRIDTILSDVRGHLLAELENAELTAASRLTRINLRV